MSLATFTSRHLLTVMLGIALVAGCGGGSGDSSTARESPGCAPSRIRLVIDGPATDLDLGSVGINFDTAFPAGLGFDLTATCPGDGVSGTCGLAAPADESRRCFDDLSHVCSSEAECAGRSCVRMFGPPIPLNAAGAPSCLLVENAALGPGTFEPTTGAAELSVGMRWTLFAGLELNAPCPICSGAALGDAGVCRGGIREGAPCRVGATDAMLGNTSVDCPPFTGGPIGSFEFPLRLTTGEAELAAEHTCVGASFAGAPCFCADQPIANSCNEGRCEVADDGEGTCSAGPADGLCAREPFRGCLLDAECPAAGDHCAFRLRRCLGAATADGIVAPLVRRGRAGVDHALLVALSCVSTGTTSAVNTALGLPGALSIHLPVRVESTSRCAGS